jgi:hypothetical protein
VDELKVYAFSLIQHKLNSRRKNVKTQTRFNEGDIVRHVDTNIHPSTMLFTVVNVSLTTGLVDVTDSIGTSMCFGNEYLELVTSVDNITVPEDPVIPVQNNPSLDEATIHSEVARMMNKITQHLAKHVEGKQIALTIHSEYYSGDSMDVSFKCAIGYDVKVDSANLRQSAEVCLQQWQQKHALKPLAIRVMRNEK